MWHDVSGGGVNGQADAVKLGIARALMLFNAELRKKLKAEGMVTPRCARQRTQEVRAEGRPQALPVQQAIERQMSLGRWLLANGWRQLTTKS